MAVVIRIKLPLPTKFYCDVCHPEDIRPTGQKLKGAYVTHYALKKHYKDKHLKDSVVQFECRCGSIFQQLREGNKHLRSCVTTAAPQLPTPEVNDSIPPDRTQYNAVPTVQRATTAVPTVQRVTAAVPTVQQVTAAVPTVQRVTARRSRIPTATLRGRPNRRMDTEGRQLVLPPAEDSSSRGTRIPCPATTARLGQRRQYTRTRPATRDAATQTHASDQSRSHSLTNTGCAAMNSQHWQDRFNSLLTGSAFEQTLKALTTAMCNDRPAPNTDPSASTLPPHNTAEEAKKLQQLYRKDPKKAWDEVRKGDNGRCNIPKAALEEHFARVYAGREGELARMPPCIPELPPPDTGNPFADPISANLVASRLAAASNTAPGPDRIRYNQWKAADPSCEIMAAIFNASVRLKYTPHSWKESTTVLLHKKGPAGNVSNWRPIALSNTLGKLYSACTASRLTDWSSRNGRLSHAQKGFSKFDGCHEHNFVLQSVINDARVQGITAVLALLDLKNAFGSAPHSVIMKALQWAGLDESATALIERLYSGCTTRIRTCEGLTAPITIASGVRQGCPLSPIIFNLTIEPMIRAILAAEEGYSLNGTPVEVLAFADDIALVSNNRNGLQHMLDIASEVATWAGLDFNAAKCASLHIDGKNSRCLPTNYSIQQQHMNALDESDLYRHLGIPTGFKYGSTGMEIVDKMAEDIEKLDKSLLAPWQKIDAVRTFVSPQISFHLKGGRTARKLLGELDRSIKMKVKKWMSLPDRASTEVLYLPHKVGGMNLFPMKTLADVCNVVQAVHLLKSPDPRVIRIARSTLNRTVERRIQASPTHNQTQDYLHGRTDGAFERPFFSHSSAWTRLRMSTRELRKKIPLEWSSSDDGVEAYLDGQRLTPANVERHLKAAIRVYLGTKLAAKPSQGKVFNVASGSSASNHFARSGNFMRFADWRFIFRARLNVVPLRGCLNFGNGPKNCRKCNYRSETLPHVLNHCGTHMLAATKRHDAVLNRLLKTIPQKRNVQVLTNQTVPESGSDLRPDIFIKDDANKTVTIIDVAIPFETSTTAFEQARNRKIEKYAGITKKYEDLGYKCFNNAFIIGALGSYDPANAACIRRLRIPHKYSVLMKRLMVCDVIRWSRDIYIEHVTGIRQFEVREMTPILGHSTN